MYFLQNKSDASRETSSDNTTGSERQCPAQKLDRPIMLYDVLRWQTVHKDLPDETMKLSTFLTTTEGRSVMDTESQKLPRTSAQRAAFRAEVSSTRIRMLILIILLLNFETKIETL